MKATLELETYISMLTFHCGWFRFGFNVSKLMTDIFSIDEFDTGYMVIQTPYGEDYVDLLGYIEQLYGKTK